MAYREEPLLQRPLYAFDLPEEILSTLTLKTAPTVSSDEPSTNGDTSRQKKREGTVDDKAGDDRGSTSCSTCGVSFEDRIEQRSHVRSDFHAYNIKLKSRGAKTVTEDEFEKLVDNLDESLSGESSESESDQEANGTGAEARPKNDTLSTLLKRQAKVSDQQEEEAQVRQRPQRGPGNAPVLWFSTTALPSELSLGIYRALFTEAELANPTNIIDSIRKRQLTPTRGGQPQKVVEGGVPLAEAEKLPPHVFLCMLSSDHFAAMVVSLTPKLTKGSKGIEERSVTTIAKKTFHRYTSRRKQGGAQGGKDQAKGGIHSAGSAIRREQERRLEAEIRDLLNGWKHLIDTAELLFIRASSSQSQHILYGPYDGQVLRKTDPRIRRFPFSTGRPTEQASIDAFKTLTNVQIRSYDEAAAAAEAAKAAENSKVLTPKKPSTPVPKLSKEDEVAQLHTTQLQALIRRSKAPAVGTYLATNNLSPDFTFFPPDAGTNHHAPTSLHLAANLNSPAVITALLVKAGADPTVKNSEGRTPFDLAGDRATRDAFRLARHSLGEARWPWDAAHVPPALTPSDAKARDEREKAEQSSANAAEAERRKAETERLRAEDARKEDDKRDRKFGKGKTMGDAVKVEKTAQEKREEEQRGMTPEMRARLERERRARAAEERMNRMQGR